jgi:peptidyl-tRNA hydrolase
MYCIYSREAIKKMGGNRGKLAAMAGHAYLHTFWDAERRFSITEGYWRPNYPDWYKYRYAPKARKIALVVETDAELDAIYEKYRHSIGATKVVDSGLTVFNEPTLACIGLGPCEQLEIPLSRVLI